MSVWQILNEQNPWWRDKSSIDRNFYVKTWLDSKIKWVCSSFDVSWGNRVIYIIKGPRQVGKSTGIILKIRDLLKEGIDPYSILYLHCEAFSSRKELEAALRNFLRSSNGKKWIFLDEVTHIKDWYISIKYFLDIGLLNNATIISTGSSSLDLARASSYLAGRKGEIKGIETDRVVLPMRFSDAIWFLVKSLPKWLSNELKRRILIAKILRGELPPEIRKLLTYWEEIEQALDKYILTGGYPLSMDKYLKKNKIPSSIYNMFITLVRRDLEREGYDPYKIDQVIKKLIDTLTTPISLEKIKSGTDIRSTTRLSDYISALQASYVITQIPFMDPQKKSIIPRKERKYYFRDPFIYHALRSWIQGVDPFESARILLAEHITKSRLIENIVAEHLLRLSVTYNQKNLTDPTSHTPYIGYWRTKKGETDFIINLPQGTIPIEVKYEETIQKRELKGILEATLKLKTKGIILTKNPEQLDITEKFVFIPVPIFLLLI